MRFLLGIILVTGLILFLSAVGDAKAVHQPGDLAPTSQCPTTSPIQMLCLHNAVRGKYGLQPLNGAADLYSAAGQKADRINECARQTGLSHHPCGDVALCPTCYGENIARGYPTVRWVFQAWLHSPGHRANILNPPWRWFGSGYRRYGLLPYLWVTQFR